MGAIMELPHIDTFSKHSLNTLPTIAHPYQKCSEFFRSLEVIFIANDNYFRLWLKLEVEYKENHIKLFYEISATDFIDRKRMLQRFLP